MSSAGLPLQPIITGGAPAPIESSTLAKPRFVGESTQSDFGAAFTSNYLQSPVVTGLTRAWGNFQDPTMMNHDDAVKIVQAQGFDPAFVPKSGMSRGTLNLEMNRQYQVKQAQIMLERGGGGGFVGNSSAALAAGFSDPSNVVLGPAFGAVADIARGGLTVRAAVGAGIGAAYTGGMEAAEAHLTGHDEDINSWSMLNHVTQGAAFFGLLHGALGPRMAPEAVQAATGNGFGAAVSNVLAREGGSTVDTGGVTKFGISAKAHPDLDIANLSQADAVKIYKSEYWDKINGDNLSPALQGTALDAAVNQGVANANRWIKESGGDVEKFNALRRAHYEELARSDPAKYGRYLQNWLARVDATAPAAQISGLGVSATDLKGVAEDYGGERSSVWWNTDVRADVRGPTSPASLDAAQGAELAREQADIQDRLSKMPQGEAAAVDRLNRLQAVQRDIDNEDLSATERAAARTRKDQILVDTTPEQLQELAGPYLERMSLTQRLSRIRDLMKENAQSVAEKRMLGQVALAQFAADNPVNVDPFRSIKPTDPVKARAVDDAARSATPDPTKASPAVSSKPILNTLDAKHGDPAALAQQFIKDAKARVTALNPERGPAFDEAVNEAPLEHEPETQLNHDDFTKAVQAALNCTIATGAKLAAE